MGRAEATAAVRVQQAIDCPRDSPPGVENPRQKSVAAAMPAAHPSPRADSAGLSVSRALRRLALLTAEFR